jgi:hypothetical protein
LRVIGGLRREKGLAPKNEACQPEDGNGHAD